MRLNETGQGRVPNPGQRHGHARAPLRGRAAVGTRCLLRSLGSEAIAVTSGLRNKRCGWYVPASCFRGAPRARRAPAARAGRELPCDPPGSAARPAAPGRWQVPHGKWLWGARGHPSHAPCSLRQDARGLLEPRAPARGGKSGDFKSQRLKLSHLTFDEYFCLLSIFSYLPNQSPLHLWCAFRAAMNFKMCKNDRILTKALIFLFIFMHFIN